MSTINQIAGNFNFTQLPYLSLNKIIRIYLSTNFMSKSKNRQFGTIKLLKVLKLYYIHSIIFS